MNQLLAESQSVNVTNIIRENFKVFLNEAKSVNDVISPQKEIIMIFFAGYCGYCRKEIPVYQKQMETLNQCGYQLLGISIDQNEEIARKTIKSWDIKFPVLFDHQQLKKILQVKGIPTVIRLNQQGLPKEKKMGAGNAEEYLKDLLKDCSR